MAEFKDKHFDLAIVDPPYGIDGNSYRQNHGRDKLAQSKYYPPELWNQTIPNDQYFKELIRISKNQIIFGGNYFPQICQVHKTPRRTEINDWIQEHPDGWIIWDKVNGSISFNDYELIRTSFTIPTYVYQFRWNGMMQGGSIFNGHIMQGKKELNQKRIHPTEKPILLYKYLLHKYSRPGSINIDTHLGSGSNALAHLDMGIDFVGCELVEKYYQDCIDRIKSHKVQMKLF